MLSNAYFLAKFRFDTAENEPAKNLQKFANFPHFFSNFPNFRAARAARNLLLKEAKDFAAQDMTHDLEMNFNKIAPLRPLRPVRPLRPLMNLR